MNSSYHNSVTDEMLSAYIDGAATAQESALIEAALAENSEVVWRLDSMQHTVALLNQLPELEPPHSFALTEAMAGIPLASQAIRTQPTTESVGFWQAIQEFFQTGNPLIRNFAAASFAAFLVLVGLGAVMGEPTMTTGPVTVLPAGSAMVSDGPQTETAESSTQVALRTSVAEAPPAGNPAAGAGAAEPMVAEATPAAARAMKEEAGEEDLAVMSMSETPAAAGDAPLELEAAAAPMAAPMAAPIEADAAPAAPVEPDEDVASAPAAPVEAPPSASQADGQAMSAESGAAAARMASEEAGVPEAGVPEAGVPEAGPPTTEPERSALWYWALISLGLAGLFAVLWLISRNNYAPAI